MRKIAEKFTLVNSVAVRKKKLFKSCSLVVYFLIWFVFISYFKGDDAELAEQGYFRNHRPDRPQIALGIVTSKEGISFAHYVFRGKTPDKNTVREVVADLKERFAIMHCTKVISYLTKKRLKRFFAFSVGASYQSAEK